MANKTLFQSLVGRLVPAVNAANHEGAPAYQMSARHELAQLASTGCLNQTFYAVADQQLQRVRELCEQVDPEFIARTALYARRAGHMKDLPALLVAILSRRSPGLMAEVFDRVIDDARMLRNFVQIMRSGQTGRKSLGTLPRRLVRQWLEQRSNEALFRASVGNDPSLADIVRMTHPKPARASRAALYAYLIGRKHDAADLPELVRAYEAFKTGASHELPDVPFQMLTSLPLDAQAWKDIAARAPWQMTRMNLNTFARHGVFESAQLTQCIADRLRDAQAIERAKVFPYQLMVAYSQADASVPPAVREALQDAMELAIRNVPAISGRVFVCPDVSGSMQSPVTGYRKGSTTAVRCVDVAALIAAAILRKNPGASVLPFEQSLVDLRLNPRDSIMTNAAKLAAVGGGGTNCSAPVAWINHQRLEADLVIFVSDNESWVDAQHGRGTALASQWCRLQRRCPKAKLVCIDIQPYGTTQAAEASDVLNIGGFSDRVFEVIALFAEGKLSSSHWVGVIEQEVI